MGYYQRLAKRTDIWVDIPDPAKKIRAQGLRHIENLEKVQSSVRQQNAEILQALKDNARSEQDNRESNWEIRQSYRDTIAEKERQRHKTILNNNEVRAENKARRAGVWDDLIKFTSTGAKFIQGIEKERTEDALQLWRQWHDEYGIKTEDINAVRNIDQQQWLKSRQTNTVWRDLRARGIPENLIEKMRGIDHYGKLAVNVVTAQTLAQTWGSQVYAKYHDKKFDIGGQQIDWDTAYASGDPVKLREIMRRLDMDEMKRRNDNFPSTRIWEYSGAARIKREIQAQFLNKQQNKKIKDAEKRVHDDEIDLIKRFTADYDGPTDSWSNGKGVIMAIEHKMGPNPTRADRNLARKEVVEALTAGILDGRIDPDVASDLLTTRFRPAAHGADGPLVKWGEYFEAEETKIKAAIAKRTDTDLAYLQAEASADRSADLQMKIDFQQIVAESPPMDQETMEGLYSRAIKEHGKDGVAAKYMASKLTSFNINVNDGINSGYVRDRIARNEHIDKDEFDALKISPGIAAGLWKEVQENNGFLPNSDQKEDIVDFVETALNQIIPPAKTYGEHLTRGPAEEGGVDRLIHYYKNARLLQKDPVTALSEAKALALKDFRNKEDKWRPTTPSDKTNGIREFSGFWMQAPEKRVTFNTVQLQQQLSGDPGSIYTQPIINKGELSKVLTVLSRGHPPDILPIASLAANYTGNRYSPLEVMMAQRELYNVQAEQEGQSLLPEFPKWYVNSMQKAESYVHPLALQYLSTPQKVNEGALKHANVEERRNPIYQTYTVQKAGNLIGRVESGTHKYNAVGSNIDPDNMSGHSKSVYGYHLTTATIDQANRIGLKYKSDLGRYQFNSESGSLLEAAQLAGLKPGDRFSPENQDKMFQAFFKKYGPSRWYGIQNLSKEDVFYLEQVHKMLNEEKFDMSWNYHNPAIVNPKVRPYLASIGRYPELAEVA